VIIKRNPVEGAARGERRGEERSVGENNL